MAELKSCPFCGGSGFSFLMEDTSECQHYKIKEDVVEVVRCKDCIHFEVITLDSGISVGFGNCKNEKGINLYPKENDFCSYGTPKERGGKK